MFVNRWDDKWLNSGHLYETSEFLESGDFLRVAWIFLSEIFGLSKQKIEVISAATVKDAMEIIVQFDLSTLVGEQSKQDNYQREMELLHELPGLLFASFYGKRQLDCNWPLSDFTQLFSTSHSSSESDAMTASHHQYLMIKNILSTGRRYFEIRLPPELAKESDGIVLGQTTYKLDIGDIVAVVVGCLFHSVQAR